MPAIISLGSTGTNFIVLCDRSIILFSRSQNVDPNQWPRRRGIPCFHTEWETICAESVYDVYFADRGRSKESWEKAAANAVEQASKSLRNLRVASGFTNRFEWHAC